MVAENIEWYPNGDVDSQLSTTFEDKEDALANLDLNQYLEYYPINSRSMGIMGTLIGPGNYSDSVDAITNIVDIYTIPLNGSIANTDIINFSVETTSANMGVASLFSPDMFDIDFNMFTSGFPVVIDKYAIIQDYHYIVVANPFMGTVNYWLNVSTTQTTNNQNDGNNDFANATAASDGSSIQESLNYTLDYWDLFEITIPTEHNVTITCEPSSGIDVYLELYNGSNASQERILASVDDGWDGEAEVLYYESNVTQIQGYLRVTLFGSPSYSPFGSYWLNFSIREINMKPSINLSNPKLNLWTSSAGVEIDEDEISDGEVILSDQFMDDGKPTTPGTLAYTYSSSDETNISVVVHANTSVTITPIANWFGDAVITFYANDSVFNISDDLNVTVNSINDLPVLNDANGWDINTTDNVTVVDATTLQIMQGYFADMNLTASDVEGDTLYFALEDFDPNTTALSSAPFLLEEDTGNFYFTPDNDAVGIFFANFSVRDSLMGTAQDWENFTFEILNANDPPMINTVDAIAPTDKAIALTATQDVDFDVEIVASDLDVARALDADELTFAVDTSKVTIEKTGNTTANLTFTPTNDDVGDVVVNITVMDEVGTEVDDYVVATITVADVNDAPGITGATDELGSALTITDKMIDLTATPLTYDAPNVTFTLTAADIDMPYGEILDWDQEDATIPTAGYMIEKENDNQSAKITIMGKELSIMEYTFNFTVMDDGTPSLSDYVLVKINASYEEPVIDVNEKPTITLSEAAKNQKIEIGDSLTINGTVTDDGLPETGTLTVKVKITKGADTLLAETAATISAGTFTYTLSKIPEKVGENSSAGTWTITVWANDGELDSTEATTTLTVEEPTKVEPDDDEDELPLSMGLFAYDILVIVIIIIIIIILILAMVMKKKKVEEEVPPPEEGMVPAEGMPPAELTCTACGQLIPVGSPTCPACGAPAPPPVPEEGMPPAEVTCTACGQLIPTGSPTCPACGAPAPPPAPPEEGMPPPEEGMAPPPEEGMAPPPEEGMAPPLEEGMPPEAPPPEEGMAPPPEGMPPEAPPPEGMPPEAPPPEGAPPEQAAPPPGMATCPQCGTQIAVGTTPCPGCGAALNW